MASSPAPVVPISALSEPLSDAQLARLAEVCGRSRAARGSLLIDFGDTASEEFFLLRGRVTLAARDGRVTEIEAGSDKARLPLARLRPRQYRVEAASEVEYLLASAEQLAALAEPARDDPDVAGGYDPGVAGYDPGVAGYEVSDVFEGQGDLAGRVFLDFVDAVRGDRIRLPTLPELAVKIRTILEDDRAGAEEVGRLVASDPAIAAKLVRLANSAAYQRGAPVRSVEGAVTRLGLAATRNVVTVFCVNELFDTELDVLRGWLERVTEHSREVAAMSFFLSRELGVLDPGQALLAGLLHEVGLIPLLVFAENYPDLAGDAASVRALLDSGAAEASELLLSSWGFDHALIDVARHVGDWTHMHDGPLNYCDLVQLAKAHCLISAQATGAPRLHEIAAFDRAGGLTAERSMRLLREARDGIAGTLSLLT